MNALLSQVAGDDRARGIVGFFRSIDWILVFAILPILAVGLITMNSFAGDNTFFTKQLVWIALSFIIFFSLSTVDFRFLRRTSVIVTIFVVSVLLLLATHIFGSTIQGAERWISFGFFAFQPSDVVKVSLILILAKYFSRRHVEIAHFKHILISGAYALVFFVLIFLQPDLGSALIVFFVWLGMVLVSGISKKHLFSVFGIGAVVFLVLWSSVFHEYQKARIMTFIHPLADIQGAGYNAYQSTVAVGSGQILGKGVGYGTQSKLQFLPEYETDFIFASFAEEWGFIGVIILFILFGIIFYRIIVNASMGASNFEVLFGAGLAILFITHFIVHIGMNIGLLPVTGTTLPFMSYGGSHLITEFVGLGILMGMRRYARPVVHRASLHNEIVGV
ncbi:MAG: rod shape-determining protein RodA [Elusimicrobia bacterium]|nr:MAG: rod shape-determining protein RodA [Elusimicrobiota bacterium]